MFFKKKKNAQRSLENTYRMNENESMYHQKLWGVTEVAWGRRSREHYTQAQINNLTLQLKEVEQGKLTTYRKEGKA
jgi:pyruvate dehydrogenase complex dehydrogenase (E1) component